MAFYPPLAATPGALVEDRHCPPQPGTPHDASNRTHGVGGNVPCCSSRCCTAKDRYREDHQRAGHALARCVHRRQGNHRKHLEQQRRNLFHSRRDRPGAAVPAHRDRVGGAYGWCRGCDQPRAAQSRAESRCGSGDGVGPDHHATGVRILSAERPRRRNRADAAGEFHQRVAGPCRRRGRDQHLGRSGRVHIDHHSRRQLHQQQ